MREKLLARKLQLTKELAEARDLLQKTFDYKGNFALNMKIADLCSRLDEIHLHLGIQ